MPDDKILKAALWYAKKGFSVIPILYPKLDEKTGKDENKKPKIEWGPYQNRIASEEEMVEWYSDPQNTRLALVTGELSGISILDCDTAEVKKQIEDLLPENFMTPMATTPRGGVHYYFKYHTAIPQKQNIIKNLDGRNKGGYIVCPPSSGLNGTCYKWLHGLSIAEIEPAIPPDSIISFLNSLSYSYIKTEIANNVPSSLNFKEGSRDQTLFHIANCLVKGGMPQIEMEQVLELIATKVCDPPEDMKKVKEKIKSASKRLDLHEKTITQEVRDFIAVTKGNFRVTDCQQYLLPVLPKGNKAILMALSRLVEKGIIERLQSPGLYRVIENRFNSVNIKNVKPGEWLDVCLPFGLDTYVKIAPGNLIVFAGVTNSGKSALIFNMIKENMERFKIWYFSSEMNQGTVKQRLDLLQGYFDWNFEIIDEWDQSIDVVQPDDLNFFDWMEAGEDTYKIADRLAKLQRKMKKGIVIVAMQKNPHNKNAIGGYQTKSKSSLYLNVDQDEKLKHRSILTVEKAKAYDQINPNGFMCKFDIFRGINLKLIENWRLETDGSFE